MNQIKLIYTITILLTLWVVSCTYRKVDSATIALQNADKVYYTPNIEAFITQNCGCHLFGGPNITQADLSTYDKVQAQAEKIVTSLSQGGAMFTYATDAQIQMLKVWIYQGIPEDASSGGGSIYNMTIVPIINTYCTVAGCHPAGDFPSYIVGKSSLTALSYSGMGTTTPAFTTSELEAYAAWVGAGYPTK